MNKQKRRWTKNEEWELQDLAVTVSQKEAARILNRGIHSVREKIRHMKIIWRSRSISTYAIAKKLRCSQTTVREVADAFSIKSYGKGTSRRFLISEIEAERIIKHLQRKLSRTRRQRTKDGWVKRKSRK